MSVSEIPAQRARKFKTGRTILALVLREMQTTYGRSPGGYLWALLEPVGSIAVFTLVISVGLKIRTPSIGTNFPLFYATGILPFSLYGETTNKITSAIRFSRQLLRYPGVRYTDAIIARLALNFLTHLLVAYVIMTGIIILFDQDVTLNVPAIALSFVLAAMLGLGVGSVNCFLMGWFPVWSQIWSILTRPLFLLSTVIYSFEQVPWRWQDVLWYNPLIHVVGLMRRGIYPYYEAEYASPLYVLGVSLICLAFGLGMLHRFHREMLIR